MNVEFRSSVNSDELAVAAAKLVQEAALAAITEKGCFTLALSGGRTPKKMFEQLVQPQFSNFPWQSVLLFWGDERFVPPEHAESNYRMARVSLLDALPVAPQAVYPVDTMYSSAVEAAEAYETTMRHVFPSEAVQNGWPCFDCILLGLGTDGHTASLFPGTAALEEGFRWASVGHAPDGSQRVTLTLPVLNAAKLAVFLVSGHEKAEIVSTIATGSGEDFPAAKVQAENVIWLLDSAAATACRLAGVCL